MGLGEAQITVDGPASDGVWVRYMRASELLESIGENVFSRGSSVSRDSWRLLREPNGGLGGCRTPRSPFLTRSPRHSWLKPDQQATLVVRGDSGRMSRRGLAEDLKEGVWSKWWKAILGFGDTVMWAYGTSTGRMLRIYVVWGIDGSQS